jgi:hypothetical protein
LSPVPATVHGEHEFLDFLGFMDMSPGIAIA